MDRLPAAAVAVAAEAEAAEEEDPLAAGRAVRRAGGPPGPAPPLTPQPSAHLLSRTPGAPPPPGPFSSPTPRSARGPVLWAASPRDCPEPPVSGPPTPRVLRCRPVRPPGAQPLDLGGRGKPFGRAGLCVLICKPAIFLSKRFS